MTSRRSRLKAVANLPVRRKIPSYQNLTDEASASENCESSCKKSDEIKNENEIKITYLSSKLQDDTLEGISLSNSFYNNNEANEIQNQGDNNNNNNNNNNNDDNTNSRKKGIEFSNNLNTISSTNVNISENVNESNSTKEKEIKNASSENFNLNDITINNKNATSKSTKCLTSSLPQNKKVCLNVSESEKIPVNCISSDSTNNCLRNSNQKNIITEAVNCLTIFTPDNETNSTTSTVTVTPLTQYQESNNVIHLDCLNVQALNENFNEVEIYSELTEPSDLFINMPVLEPIETNESPTINTHIEEPILTTLVNCTADTIKENSNLNYNDAFNQNLYSNEYNGTNINQETNRKDNSSKISVNAIREKLLTNHYVFSGTENLILNSDSNSSLRKNMSTFKRKRAKCSDFTKKLADARREFQKKYDKTKPDRSSLKMIDLIFYNPASNPMESKHKMEKKEGFSRLEIGQNILAEEGVDEPEELDCASESQSQTEDSHLETLSRMPVPQVKIGSNGEIILDEKSLIIETTDTKKGREDLQNVVPVFEERGSKVSYYRSKCRKSRDWTDLETKRFYKALNTIGPDFSLMQKYFPKRSRVELKNKFKREERFNRSLVDKALINPSEFDMTRLEKDLAVEKKAEEEAVEKKLCKGMKVRQLTKRPRTKSSFLSREMIEANEGTINCHLKSSDFNSKKFILSEKDKKRREIKFILKKFVLNETENEINELHKNYKSSHDVFVSTNENLL